MDQNTALVAGYLIGLFVACLAIGGYLWAAYVWWRIGKKFGIGTFGQYCIPVYNCVLACHWIGLSGWAALWFFLPWLVDFGIYAYLLTAPQFAAILIFYWFIVVPLSVVFLVYFWGSVARRLGKSFWLYGITSVLFLGIPILFLAFDETRPQGSNEKRDSVVGTPSGLSLYCVSGELAQTRLQVPGEGLYIGRNPSKASLVLHSDQISNVHARVWPDADGAGLWVEDWNSLNGTYYCRSANGERARSKWNVLHGRILLNDGARFRLGDKVAEFEVRAA